MLLVAITVPLRPGTQAHPLGTLMPVENGGQATALHWTVVGNEDEIPEHAGMDEDIGEKPGRHDGGTGFPLWEFKGQVDTEEEEEPEPEPEPPEG